MPERIAVSPSDFGCPLCPRFITKTETVIQRHLKNHTENAVHFQDKLICRCNLSCRDAGHFHCPFCAVTIIQKHNMIAHLTGCEKKIEVVQRTSKLSSPETRPKLTDLKEDFTASPSPSLPPSTSYSAPASESALTLDHSYSLTALPKTPKDFGVPSSHVKCSHCSMVLYRQNLVLHIQRKHGPPKDITAQFHLKGTCVDPTNGLYVVRKTGRGFSVPVHVQRRTHGHEHVTKCERKECHQYHLLAENSELSHNMCHHIRSLDYCSTTATEEPLQHKVLQEMVDNLAFGDWKVDLCKKRQQEAEEAHAPLSVLVDLGGADNHIFLSVFEPRLYTYSTLGRVMVTYNLKKNTWHCPCAVARPSCPHKCIAKWHLFQTHKNLFITAPQVTTHSGPTTAEMGRTVRYLYECKKIPATLPKETTSQRALTEYPQQLFPMETTCKMCPGSPKLEEAVQTTDKATIVCMEGVIEDISTYTKRCTKCHMVYRYQEWSDGLHNFNDHVILTLRLCLYLRHNPQNHVSVSRVISSLESLLKETFPAPSLIFHGYCHFEALCNTEYRYSCVNCGFHSPVVVMDLQRKGVLNFEVSELEQPEDDYHGEHDIVAFWETVHLNMISQGFYEYPSQNPLVVKPTYENWATWIEEETRKSSTVLNTEFEKAESQKSSGKPRLCDITEDHLVDELLKQKVSTIRKLCENCNMDTKGSRMDLVNRLQEEMKSRQTYDEVFQSIWGASGDWSVIMCPHGIVYSLKFNLGAESPKDLADLLLSWKHLPNVCVYNSAHGLVARVNLSVPDNPPFQPFKGRLADPTPENAEAAAQGNRRIQMVPELQATLKRQVAEQLLACLRNNDYFLNNMGPSAHIFLMRNILEHRNSNQNEKLLQRQFRRTKECQELLEGKHAPVVRLKRKAEQDIV